MNQLRKVCGTVLKLRCAKCNQSFSHFRLMGEADTDTAGIGSVTSCEKNEIVIAEINTAEWNSLEAGGALQFEKRISQQLGRDDLRVLRLLRVEQPHQIASGISFKEFQKKFVQPLLVFSCIYCTDGESISVAEESIEEFRRSGGQVSILTPLTL